MKVQVIKGTGIKIQKGRSYMRVPPGAEIELEGEELENALARKSVRAVDGDADKPAKKADASAIETREPAVETRDPVPAAKKRGRPRKTTSS